jgi:hypothetical protein
MDDLKAELYNLKTLLSNSEKVRIMEMKARDNAEKEAKLLKIENERLQKEVEFWKDLVGSCECNN